MKRIGLLTSGGDCQALNATMRGVVKGLSTNLEELEVYGFDDGYKGHLRTFQGYSPEAALFWELHASLLSLCGFLMREALTK